MMTLIGFNDNAGGGFLDRSAGGVWRLMILPAKDSKPVLTFRRFGEIADVKVLEGPTAEITYNVMVETWAKECKALQA